MGRFLTQVCQSPRVYVADDFVTADEAGRIVERGASPATLEARGVRTAHDRTGFSFELPVDGDPLLEEVRARVHAAVGLENVFGQTFRYRHYRSGESHPPHLDCYEIQGHHLVCTALLNLTDCRDGGETRFPHAYPTALAIDARRGRLVCWFNYYPNGAPDEASCHEGGAVRDGEKITITAFIYRPLGDARARPQVAGGASS